MSSPPTNSEQEKSPPPATLQAFLSLRSDLDLTGKVHRIGIFQQSFGGYSDVYTAYCKLEDNTESKVAVKKLRVRFDDTKGFEKDLVKELYIWSKLNHPRILHFEGFFLAGDIYPALVSKWMEGGTVLKYLETHSDTDLIQLVLGTAEGINYLHSSGFVHSDIKPDNILISDLGEPLLCDFGISRNLSTSRTFAFSKSLAEQRGTVRFMSKELLSGLDGEDVKHSRESDVWAFGMTVLSLLTQMPPYHQHNDKQAIALIIKGELPSLPTDLESWPVQNQILWYMCKYCWRIPSRTRPRMLSIIPGLERVQDSFGSVLRPPMEQNEAFVQALWFLLPSIPKVPKTALKDLIREDPGGDFLRIFVDDGITMNDALITVLRTTTPPCFELESTPVYFSSVAFRGTITPGRFSEQHSVPFLVPCDRTENAVRHGNLFSVLVFEPELMELVPTSYGSIPEGRVPVVGGRENDRSTLYHAVADIDGVRVPGKAASHLGGSSIGYRGKEWFIEKYEILCWKE